MKAMFVNEDEWIYAKAIVYGYKTIETRSRDMLGKLVGERVAVIRTRHGKKPMVIGYVTIGYRYYEDNLDALDRLERAMEDEADKCFALVKCIVREYIEAKNRA